jgi:hypothetical protein
LGDIITPGAAHQVGQYKRGDGAENSSPTPSSNWTPINRALLSDKV